MPSPPAFVTVLPLNVSVLVAASSTALKMPMPGGLLIALLLIVPVTVEVSFVSMLITPLPPAPLNVLLVMVRLVVVNSCPLTTTPPARPGPELIVLFENVSDKVPLAFKVLAPICVDALTMLVNVEPVIDAVRLAAPLGSSSMALLAVPLMAPG